MGFSHKKYLTIKIESEFVKK